MNLNGVQRMQRTAPAVSNTLDPVHGAENHAWRLGKLHSFMCTISVVCSGSKKPPQSRKPACYKHVRCTSGRLDNTVGGSTFDRRSFGDMMTVPQVPKNPRARWALVVIQCTMSRYIDAKPCTQRLAISSLTHTTFTFSPNARKYPVDVLFGMHTG